ncbi:signal peptidase II [Nitrosophilus kaiyonis]|uniref:signal peptidase II n=1 Tax=Nitrosophilus kaiyonis TaxID=2930200 RepID=UPI00248F6863|nr:signal peptidase II [Nitrosophilus kaiyonis]
MIKNYFVFFLAALGIFLIDKSIKELFINGLFYDTKCITFGFTLNKGVAFSLLSFLNGYLKWILFALILSAFIYVNINRLIFKIPFVLGILFGAAIGNLYDRFIYGGVVDYVYWHCGFDFAVFNFADVMIDLSIAWLFYLHFIQKKI